ncbi:MAG: ABC transporter permease [Pseudomonadota bacterium]
MMREMSTRFGRSSGGFVWAFLEPAGFIMLLSLIFVFMSRSPPLGSSFPLFYASGFLPFYIFKTVSAVTSHAVRYNHALLTYPNVTPTDTILARFMLQTLTNCLVTIGILGGLLAVVDYAPVISAGILVQAVALASLLGLGIGTLNAVLFHIWPVWERCYGILTHPLLIISGIFYLPDMLPPNIRDALYWNPVVHPVSLMRTGVYAHYEGVHVDIGYVAWLGVSTFLAGMCLLHLFRARLTEQ